MTTTHDRLTEIDQRVASRGEVGYEADPLAIAREMDAELQEAREIIDLFMDEYASRYGIDGAYDEPMERGRAFLARHKEDKDEVPKEAS